MESPGFPLSSLLLSDNFHSIRSWKVRMDGREGGAGGRGTAAAIRVLSSGDGWKKGTLDLIPSLHSSVSSSIHPFIHPPVHPSSRASIVSCIRPPLHPSSPASILPCIPPTWQVGRVLRSRGGGGDHRRPHGRRSHRSQKSRLVTARCGTRIWALVPLAVTGLYKPYLDCFIGYHIRRVCDHFHDRLEDLSPLLQPLHQEVTCHPQTSFFSTLLP